MSRTFRILLLALFCVGGAAAGSAGAQELYPDSDTLTVNQKRQMRGLTSKSNVFVPKGQWVFGGTASYSTHTNRDYNFLVIEDIASEGYTFRVSPFLAYAVNLTVDSYYVLRHSYEGAVTWRNYIPLGHSKRFAIFTDMQLSAGGIQGKFAEGQPVRGTYESGYSLGLGVSPGLVAFATNNMAIEVSVGVMGLSYSHVRQVHNQVTTGNRSTSNMNFKVNIFSIGLGMAFYL